MRAKPLSGVKVLDLTRLLPGPVCTMHLADMGADVLKIEDPDLGDYARSMGHPRRDMTQFFVLVNRNKRAMALDLKRTEDRARFLALAETADVVVESFRPGVMARLGLGYETLAARNPRLVVCAITGYGQDGPLAHAAGHDINYVGYAGALDQFGDANDRPALPNFQIGDLLGGALTAAMGILAAVIDARTSGQGRHVDVSMTDAVFAHNLMALIATNEDGAPRRAGQDLLNGGVPCYGVYETADGRYMAVGALEAKFWQTLCEALDRPEWTDQHWSRGQAPGSPEARALRDALQAILRTRTQAQWTEFFAGRDCCVTPILRADEALRHPLFQARGMAVEAEHPTEGRSWHAALPVKFSDDRFEIRLPAPARPK